MKIQRVRFNNDKLEIEIKQSKAPPLIFDMSALVRDLTESNNHFVEVKLNVYISLKDHPVKMLAT